MSKSKKEISSNAMLPAVPSVKLDWMDVEEVAAYLCGIDYDEDNESRQIENALWEQYEIPFDSLHRILEKLLPAIDVGSSVLTKTRYKGFVRIDKHGFGTMMIKTEVPTKQ